MIAYHFSHHVFNRPDYAQIRANRTNHENGALGLWVAMEDTWARGFGENKYTICFDDSQAYQLPVHKLSLMRFDEEQFSQMRDNLMEKGYKVIHIVESSGSIDMMVIMDFDCIIDIKHQKITS
jgi:hypothetical protein